MGALNKIQEDTMQRVRPLQQTLNIIRPKDLN